jgi:hypothetical protein
MSTDSDPSNFLGKKIFFLHPSTIVQNEIVAELVQQEFEVYIARDHAALAKVLKRYPGSIVFADIDERMSEASWESWIRGIINNPETMQTAIGILSVNGDELLARKYVNSIKVQCGYTVIKADLNSVIRQLMEILKVMDAKGRRKYIRVVAGNEIATTINLPMNGTFVTGIIKDISAVGLSCSFAVDPELTKNTLFQNIQIKLQSMLLKIEGIVFGSRMDGPSKIYVILFTKRVDPDTRTKIRRYIQHNYQSKMDAELK